MNETLNLLLDYAAASDNLWLSNKMQLLEKEIEIELIKAKLSLLDEFSNEQKLILKKPNKRQ
tara:strand:- start:180 stop:365 length:186 start_codon:yes stop_codon:yes gene_type:complete